MFNVPTPIVLPVPHLRQKKWGECLPTCAYMVLTYIKRRTIYWRLRHVLGTKEFGTPFSNIQNLERMGVTVEFGNRGNFDLLYDYLTKNQPCIVSVETSELPHWHDNTLHAVVVVGMDKQLLYINDPEFEKSPIPVSYGDFDLAWLAQNERYAVLSLD